MWEKTPFPDHQKSEKPSPIANSIGMVVKFVLTIPKWNPGIQLTIQVVQDFHQD